MKKDKFRPRRAIENQYRQAIGRILRKMRGRLCELVQCESFLRLLISRQNRDTLLENEVYAIFLNSKGADAAEDSDE